MEWGREEAHRVMVILGRCDVGGLLAALGFSGSFPPEALPALLHNPYVHLTNKLGRAGMEGRIINEAFLTFDHNRQAPLPS